MGLVMMRECVLAVLGLASVVGAARGQAGPVGGDPACCYTTLGLTTALVRQFSLEEEVGVALGRTYVLGRGGRLMVGAEVGGGYVRDGGVFPSGRVGAALAWPQDLVSLSEHSRMAPYVSAGGSLYRFGWGPPAREAWVPAWWAGIGLRLLGNAGAASSGGTMMELELVREERRGGWGRRVLLRTRMGWPPRGTRGTAAIGTGAWWREPAPPLPAGRRYRAAELPRRDLPHHHFGYWGERRLPGLSGDPDLPREGILAAYPDLESAFAALALDPEDPVRVRHVGVLLARRHRRAEALRAFERALAAPGTTPAERAGIHADAAIVLAALGLAEGALAMLDRALAQDPASLVALVNRGVLLEEMGRPDDAARAYATATERLPDAPHPWENLAYALVRNDRHDEALPIIEHALRLRFAGPRQTTREPTRWACTDLALFRELTGENWRGMPACGALRPLPTPRMLPGR